MKRLFTLVLALSAAAILASCDTTGTYVKDDASIPVAGDDSPAVKAQAAPVSAAAEPEQKDASAGIKIDSDTIAVIGKYVLTKEKYRILRKYMEEKYNYKLSPDQEKEFVEYIVNKKLMALEGRSMGIADRTDVKVKYEWDFDDTVSHDYYNEVIEKKSGVTADDAKKYYEANKEDFVEIKAQHILIKNKSMADSIYKRILAGENFEELAKKYSEDETTKASGGNLGFFTKDVMVKEFEDAAFATAAGEISPPVKSIYGYHIIKVLERKKISFEDSKDRIISMIKNKRKKEVFDAEMEALKKKYGAKINTDLIK